MARPIRDRFEALVDRSGEHHLWTGATRPDTGTGRMKVGGKHVPAPQVAWELAHGPLPAGGRVLPCVDLPACVRVEHLRVVAADGGDRRRRARKGSGSMREVAPGVWELSITAGRYDDGKLRRQFRRVRASHRADATRQLAAFVAEAEVHTAAVPSEARDLTFDEAVERFLTHLQSEKGRALKTVEDYRRLHGKWFSPTVGQLRVRRVDEAAIDKVFGQMLDAGLSRSRMNQARSLYAPFFKWARARQFVTGNPMAEFQLPTSRQVSKERTPPEAGQLCMLLHAAVALVPDVAPVLTLGAVTGMRRGELVGLRRSDVQWDKSRLGVSAAVDSGRRVKTTKTRKERSIFVDSATLAMLRRHLEDMEDRAVAIGVDVPAEGFVFSLAPDCSVPMPPDYLTKRVAVLKEHLGLDDKRPATIVLEDDALRLFRQPQETRRVGRTGPLPNGAKSYREIGEMLGRSERWAALAVASALRRERAAEGDRIDRFDASILALRKFTSSELLDAGFNMSMVAQRQGHGPLVLLKHYAKSRTSADRRAAEHLGAIVHGGATKMT